MIQCPDTASTRAHKPTLTLTKMTYCSFKTETIPGDLLCLHYNPSLISPSLSLQAIPVPPAPPPLHIHPLLAFLSEGHFKTAECSMWYHCARPLKPAPMRQKETWQNLGNFCFEKRVCSFRSHGFCST